MERLSRADLLKLRDTNRYLEYVRSVMKDFCFTIDRHSGKDRVWFGSHTVTINRNLSFNFYDHDVRDDKGLEPYPVIRSDAPQTLKFKVQPYEDDSASAYEVVAFYIERSAFDAALKSLDAITDEYEDLRTLPDSYFPDAPAIRLLSDRLLSHPAVKAERVNDWPPFPI